MKTKLSIYLWINRILFGSLLISGISYIFLDRHLFYYGQSSSTNYDLLPLGIIPENRPNFEGGFVLWEGTGLSLVGKGVRYFKYDSILIDKLNRYGFNSDELVAEITDSEGRIQNFMFKKNTDPDYRPYMRIELIDEDYLEGISEIEWINVNSQKEGVVRAKFIALWIFILLFIGTIRYNIKTTANKATR